MILLASNNASGKLLSGINNTAISVTLQTGQGALFPSPVSTVSYFYLAHVNPVTNLVDEIVQVTAVSGDTFTIVRGQEGTTAVAWLTGDIVGDYFTAGSFNALAQKQQVQSNLFNYYDDTGEVNDYVVTLSPVPVVVDGFEFSFSTANTNTTTAPTVTLNGTAYTIVNPAGGGALVAGQIPANSPIRLVYNSFNGNMEIQSGNYLTVANGQMLRTANVTPVPVSSGSGITASHSLGYTPFIVILEYVCLTGEQNYSMGDVVEINSIWSGTNSGPLSIWKNTTGFGVVSASGTSIGLQNKTTGAYFSPTAANWASRFSYR